MTAQNLDKASTGWTVTGQTETTEMGPTGTFTSGRRITFQTADGNVGSVFVQDTSYNVDSVRGIIRAAAAQVDAVGALSE